MWTMKLKRPPTASALPLKKTGLRHFPPAALEQSYTNWPCARKGARGWPTTVESCVQPLPKGRPERLRWLVLAPGDEHEAPRFHHASRRRGGLAARGARAAARPGASDWHPDGARRERPILPVSCPDIPNAPSGAW